MVLPLVGGELLVAASQHRAPQDGLGSRYVTTTHYVVNLATGRVRSAQVPDLPHNGRPWIYADAAALGDDAAHRAFTPGPSPLPFLRNCSAVGPFAVRR